MPNQSEYSRKIFIPTHFAAPVIVKMVEEEDGEIYLTVITDAGRLEQLTLSAQEWQEALNHQVSEAQQSVPALDQFLLIEAERIRLSYAYDPHFAVSLSGVEPLPHQLEAVYEHMLPQAQLRFLLADDPGAGKTIMAGLLIKELKMRGAAERILVLCPAPLTIQWQDEMRSKFDEIFEVIRSELAKDQLAGNAWERFPQCITSIDFAKRDDILPALLRTEWDLVVIDEAHKCAARYFGGDVRRTRRYQLAEMLSQQADRLLLLTATPHSGDVQQFAYFLRLLDSDQFIGPDRVDEFAELNQQALIAQAGERSPWFLRRIKEELRNFDGKKLFTQRHANTVPFTLSDQEHALYESVTDYINQFLPRQSGKRKAPVALARTVLQRRLASSIRSIRRSLERRYDRFNGILREINNLPVNRREQFLRDQNLLDIYDEEQEYDDLDEMTGEEAAQLTAAERLDDLMLEVAALRRLVEQARRLEDSGDERKLTALLHCLRRAEFADLQDGRGKLLIFTEHKDTLDYLREKLEPQFSVVEIHGGMNAQRRKQAQEEFRTSVQVCLATDAAGEGINLQFCHLMINYDMPWNPMRLEQRMGRVHRINQKYDVYIFNFVATNTVEGRVLERLLSKLESIRGTLGDRVFDVIGQILRLNDVDLEALLREAAYNPRRIDDPFYLEQIERITPARLTELERATGVAMATNHVDLGRIQAQDYLSEERRLMPEYVEKYFCMAASKADLAMVRRADSLYRIDHVSSRFRSTMLSSVKRFGMPDSRYAKLTFNKRDLLDNPSHADAELLSPGHPLFASVAEVLDSKLADVRGGIALYQDAAAAEPYRLHFFTIELIGEEPMVGGYRTTTQYAMLAAVLEAEDGHYEVAAPDRLHDLEPLATSAPITPLDQAARQKLDRFVSSRIQRMMLEEQRHQREREIEIRSNYLTRSFEALINTTQRKYWDLADKVSSGEAHYRIARDEASRRVDELEARRDQKLDDLKHLRVLRGGPQRYLGTADVQPLHRVADPAMHSDPDVEQRAMAWVMDYERQRGWLPEDISRSLDGSGFDIRSIGPRDAQGQLPIRRIEVKGRSGYNLPVALTTNEWMQAARHTDSYWLYVVYGAGEDQQPQLIPIQNPYVKLSQHAQAIVKHYLLPYEAITQV